MPAMEASSTAAVESPADVAKRDFEALGRRDADGMAACYAEDAVVDFVPVGERHGPAEIGAFLGGLFKAVPDLEAEWDITTADDQVAVIQWTMRGTFTGEPFMGVEATGKPVELRGVDVMKIADGKIQHNTAYYDGMDFARQIGMMPAADSGAEKAMIGAFNAVTKLRGRLSGS
jgi:steroid delta-isomerase-like uncharacterized protein